MKKILNQKGSSLLELLIVGVIITVSFTAVSAFLLFSRDITLKANRQTEAVAQAEAAIEAIRGLRDQGWGNIVAITSPRYLQPDGSLGTTIPNSYYTTTVTLSLVKRDSNHNISSSGTDDNNTRKVDVTVTWQESGTQKVELTTYITNFYGN